MLVNDVQCVLESSCSLGESPVWDARTETLYSVDINLKQIHVFVPESGQHRVLQLSEAVGTVLPTSDPNQLVAALERDVVLVNAQTGEVLSTVVSTPEEHGLPADGWRFNDGKASPGGQLIVGRMHKDWRKGTAGRVYSVSSGASEPKQIMTQDVVTLPNGMAWDLARKVMYFADTGASAIFAYPTDSYGMPEPGAARKTVANIPTDASHGPPDGITVDSDGNIWAALAETGSIVCYSPSGEELHRVALPVKRPTACTFGGPDLGTLYVTTREEPGSDPSPNAGGLFAAQIPGVKGAAAAYAYAL